MKYTVSLFSNIITLLKLLISKYCFILLFKFSSLNKIESFSAGNPIPVTLAPKFKSNDSTMPLKPDPVINIFGFL